MMWEPMAAATDKQIEDMVWRADDALTPVEVAALRDTLMAN
jgi:hypothetical protein